MKIIQTRNGFGVAVDDDDFERCKDIKWYARKQDYQIYVYGHIGKYPHSKTVAMHRFILDAKCEIEVDHINGTCCGVFIDNRRCNLRISNRSLNMRNRSHAQRNSKSGIPGVRFRKARNCWESNVYPNSKRLYIGSFSIKEQAQIAVESWKAENNYRNTIEVSA